MIKKCFKQEKGITLIALVITIIVLLILAGVSINLVVGESGILSQSQGAVKANQEATAREQVSMAWGSAQTDYIVDKTLTGATASEYFTPTRLNSYLSEGEITKVGYGVNAEGNSELVYKINNTYYKMIISGADVKIDGKATTTEPSITEPIYTAYSRGQTVSLRSNANEQFYVLEASDANTETVTLLAAKNIDTNSANTTTYLTQVDSAPLIAFSVTNGWSAGDNLNEWNSGSLKTDGSSAVYYAVQYGTKIGGTGRLLTVEEVKEITGATEYGTITTPEWINTTEYWLGSASGTYGVWRVLNNYLYDLRFDDVIGFGVRPVIEISKSLIQ